MIRPPGCLLNSWALTVGAYSRWALFQGLWYCKEIVQRVAWSEYFGAMPLIAICVRRGISYMIRCLISSLYNWQTYQCYMFWTSKAEYNEFEVYLKWICYFLNIDRYNWSCILLTFVSHSLCLSLARVTKINFLHTISIHHPEKRLREFKIKKRTKKRKTFRSSIKNSQVLSCISGFSLSASDWLKNQPLQGLSHVLFRRKG